METSHFLRNISKNGEKTDVASSSIYEIKNEENKHLKTKLKTYENNNKNKNNNVVIQYFRTFIYYTRARSNVYIFAFATLVSLILGSHGFANVNPVIATSAVIAGYFMALAAYVYNDITDFEVDKINKTNRPSVTGKATKRQIVIMVYVLNGIALLLTSLINFYALIVSIAFIAIGVAYSHPKLNLKDKFPLKTVVTAAGAGLLSLLGGAAALTTTNTNFYLSYSLLPTIYAALFFFAFFFILGPLGDIADLKGDRAVGRRTFPIVIGIRSTIMMMFSIPITIILMTTLLAYYYYDSISNSTSIITGIYHMNPLGIYFTIGSCIATMAFILRVSKKANDVLAIKSMRPKMRFLHIILQISLLLAFI